VTVEVAELVLLAVAALVGGAAQSALGFGAAFTTVPALALVAPELLPGSALVSFLPLTLWMAVDGRADADRRSAARVMLARVPGIAAGTAAVALADADALAVGVAVVLLAAVTSSLAGWTVRTTPVTEAVAGVVSGFCGTAVGLGGPPLAVLYRDRAPAESRATMAAVFAVGIVLSLASLAATGGFTVAQARAGALLGVAIMAGLAVAAPLLRLLTDAQLRRGLLVWAAGGSAAALLRVLLG
jgi:uncharacterized protein